MTEEENSEIPASEDVVAVAEDTVQEDHSEDQKMVPLTALQETRRKLQEANEEKRLLREHLDRLKAPSPEPEEPEDENELLNRGEFRQEQALSKREIREEVFKDMNPKAMEKIKQFLNPILEKKPWLADTIKNSENRYARASEIIDDYMHLVNPKSSISTSKDGTRIVHNMQKPASPVTLAKSASPNNMEYLRSIQGKKEFREYRDKVRRGEL